MTADNSPTVAELQSRGAARLREAGVENAALDSRMLLAEAMSLDASMLVALGNEPVGPDHVSRFEALIEKRAEGMPVHRINGRREFFGRSFSFGEESLVPRPETELLVERILQDQPLDSTGRFVEAGVGSGVIIVTLLAERQGMRGLGLDVAAGALDDTLKNATQCSVADRITLTQSDCFEKVDGRFDFIVSNPPYISTSDLGMLAREVREHDPHLALDGGPDGLRIYEKILTQGIKHVKAAGRLYLETGHGQHKAICEMAQEMGWGIVSTHLDLSGLERIVVLQAD